MPTGGRDSVSANSSFKDLLRVLGEFEVRYLIVGGYAVMRYSEPRFTKDLDVWVEASADNAVRVFRALAAFGAPLASVTQDDFATEGNFYLMGRPPVRVDVLTSVDGLKFAECWERRMESSFDGVSAYFVSRDDLIVNKRATGRLQDLADVERLESGSPGKPPTE